MNSGWVPGGLDPPPQASPSPPIKYLALPVVKSELAVLLVKGQLGSMLAGRLVPVLDVARMVRLPPFSCRAGGACVAH